MLLLRSFQLCHWKSLSVGSVYWCDSLNLCFNIGGAKSQWGSLPRPLLYCPGLSLDLCFRPLHIHVMRVPRKTCAGCLGWEVSEYFLSFKAPTKCQILFMGAFPSLYSLCIWIWSPESQIILYLLFKHLIHFTNYYRFYTYFLSLPWPSTVWAPHYRLWL